MNFEIWPVNYYFFGYDSDNPESVVGEINRLIDEQEMKVNERIDCGCILNQGVFLNVFKENSLDSFDALPNNSSRLVYAPSGKALLLFYVLISHYLNQAELPNFKFMDYLKNIKYD
jgi:hypothetical protein